MEELLKRLEEAQEGSEALDVAIARAIFGYKTEDPMWHVMEYSRSLDAALSLVPEGYFWAVRGGLDDIGAPRGYEGSFSAHILKQPFVADENIVWANSPALALVIACLRARQAAGTGG